LAKFSQFLVALNILKVNCNEVAGNRSRKPAYEIFSINSDFSPSLDLCVQADLRRQVSKRSTVPPKSDYFTAVGSSGVKTVADRQRHAAYRNKH